MRAYDALGAYLKRQIASEVPMTFDEIERLTGHVLPKSSSERWWWSNNPSNNVMTVAWLGAGFVSERVDLAGRRLVFRRTAESQADPDVGSRAAAVNEPRGQPFHGHDRQASDRRGSILDAVRARLGGTVTVPEGVDLTAPSGEVWDAER